MSLRTQETLWFCEDTSKAHATCRSTWSIFGSGDLDFKCYIYRYSTKKAEYEIVVEDVASTGIQDSTQLDTPLYGTTPNYCVKNLSELEKTIITLTDSFQHCMPWDNSGGELQ